MSPGTWVLPALAGRYTVFRSGLECGEERWEIRRGPDGYVVTGTEERIAPDPHPGRHEWRATLSPDGRLTGLEVLWTSGPRRLRETHEASGGRWRVRVEEGTGTREEEGEFPAPAEVDFGATLASLFMLARRRAADEGGHEFPVLRVGPPGTALRLARLRLRPVERGTFAGPAGPVAAIRYVASRPPRPESEGYTFWADEGGLVLESYEGLDTGRAWARLVEVRRGT